MLSVGAITVVFTLHIDIANYRREVINTKSRWMGYNELYTGMFNYCMCWSNMYTLRKVNPLQRITWGMSKKLKNHKK